MKSVKVLYPKKNFSGFDYAYNQQIMERVYDEEGNFDKRVYHDPALSQYEIVGSHEVNVEDNTEIFQWVIMDYNFGDHTKRITTGINEGILDTGFSSFSTGCVVQIDDDYFISNGMTFDQLPAEFSNK